MNINWNATVLVLWLIAFHCAQCSAEMIYDYAIDLGEGYLLQRLDHDAFMIRDPGRDEVLTIDPIWHHRKLTGYCRVETVICIKATDLDEMGHLLLDSEAAYFVINKKDNSCTQPLTDIAFKKILTKMALSEQNIGWIVPRNPCSFWGIPLFFCGGLLLPVPLFLMLWHCFRLNKRLLVLESKKHLLPLGKCN